MTLTIIIEEYYNLICEMNNLLIILNGVLEDSEKIQFIKEINEYLLSDEGYNHQLKLYKEHNFQGDRSLNQIKLVKSNRNFN